MRNIIALFAALLLSFSANAGLIWRDGDNALLLLDKPCASAKVLEYIEPVFHPEFKSAASAFSKRAYEACWREVPTDMIPEPSYFIVDEEGDAGFMPKSMFKEDDGKGPGIEV
jgi:hypothetical protein